jgi:hypothetical protein
MRAVEVPIHYRAASRYVGMRSLQDAFANLFRLSALRFRVG